MTFISSKKTNRLLFSAMCFFPLILTIGCLSRSIILPPQSSIDYDSQGYLEVTIGPYSFYLPSRFEEQHKLISKINSITNIEPFNGALQIEIPNQRFFLEAKDYCLFALVENPLVDRIESSVVDTLEWPSPKYARVKFYLNSNDFWQYQMKYDSYLRNYWLFENGRYVLKISFAGNINPTKKELVMILSSVKKEGGGACDKATRSDFDF